MLSLMHENARASRCLPKHDLKEVKRLAVCATEFLSCRYDSFVREDPAAATLQIYSNDSTPLKAKVHVSLALSDTAFKRKAHQGAEVLVQCCFCRRVVAGELQTRMKLTEPTALTRGKDAKSNMLVSLDTYSPLRCLGLSGIAIEIKIFDRALMSALKDLHHRNHLYAHTRMVHSS
jgi:hypothetical protein